MLRPMLMLVCCSLFVEFGCVAEEVSVFYVALSVGVHVCCVICYVMSYESVVCCVYG